MRFLPSRVFTIALLSFFPVLGQAGGKPFKVNTTELTQELQKQSHGEGFKLVWWIPNEFWIASSNKPGDMDSFLTALEPYIIVAAIDGSVSQLASFSYKSEDEIRKNIKIFDNFGKAYSPLDTNMISGDVNNVISIIKPILINAMGEMGKNFIFFVFSKNGKDGKPIALPRGTGRFHIEHSGEDYYYRLPLAALSPKLKCKDDSELYPSNYHFCPYHGSALISQN